MQRKARLLPEDAYSLHAYGAMLRARHRSSLMSDNAGRPDPSAHVTSRRELRGALQTASRIVVDNPDLARQVALSRGEGAASAAGRAATSALDLTINGAVIGGQLKCAGV
jgi:hypothetical protein